MTQLTAPLSAPVHLSAEAEWRYILEQTPQQSRAWIADVVDGEADVLASFFYREMLADPAANAFLNNTIVQERLHGSMMRWLRQIYARSGEDTAQLAAQVALQRHVGEVHARIQLPIHLVARGARKLKHRLFEILGSRVEEPAQLHGALCYVSQIMDLALELMSAAYMRDSERGARADEAFRLFSLGQNMQVERERQRSSLLEWGHELFVSLHREVRPTPTPSLGASEFGLWFNHKAVAMFESAPELEQIQQAIEHIDQGLLPQLAETQERDSLISDIARGLDGIKFLLSALFERFLEVENSRDALTHLLGRRFLPAVINREIRLAQSRGTSFAVVMLDMDHFKQTNDQYGHDAGDRLLQQAAALLLGTVRSGDFVFRYGGEEMLIMLVEVDDEQAARIAENIRSRFEDSVFLISEGRQIRATVSIGVAMYDGHPDYEYLIKRADGAMYQAKQRGRNQVVRAS